MQMGSTEPVIALHPSFQLPIGSHVATAKHALWWDPSAELPFAEHEARAFLQAFPDAVVCRSASEIRKSYADGYDHLHVLCHGDHNPRNPMFSVLKFSDGDISAREVAASGLRLQHANVAACSSGTLTAISSHEPDGLVRGFLACGAQSVIASAWPLDDEAGLLLSKELFAGQQRGLHVRDALRAARTQLRTFFPHPYFWGCSTLFGGYKP
jgi:CHAT domain-containing protein